MKRYRTRNPKPGQLIAYYGRIDGDYPDVVFAWGEGVSKRCGNLLHYILGTQRMEIALTEEERRQASHGMYFHGKTALQRLEDAGFDLTTIRFSIEKKKPEAAGTTQPEPASERA